jgi:hypothetical protein
VTRVGSFGLTVIGHVFYRIYTSIFVNEHLADMSTGPNDNMTRFPDNLRSKEVIVPSICPRDELYTGIQT